MSSSLSVSPSSPRQVYGVVAQPIAQDLHFEITTHDLAWAYPFFNLAYAIGMFFMGHIADRTNIRLFLGMCMICAGVFCMICGVLQLADCTLAVPLSLAPSPPPPNRLRASGYEF